MMLPLADVFPHGSNAYDVALTLIVGVLGIGQLLIRRRADLAHDRADRAAIKAESTQQAMPESQRQTARKVEERILVDNGYTLRQDLRKRGKHADRRGGH